MADNAEVEVKPEETPETKPEETTEVKPSEGTEKETVNSASSHNLIFLLIYF